MPARARLPERKPQRGLQRVQTLAMHVPGIPLGPAGHITPRPLTLQNDEQ